MKTVSAIGLVLRTRKYSEADHLLSLLSPELGKIAAIAKGARKTKGSMRGKTQPFVYGKYLLYKGKNLYTVTQAEIIYSFNKLGDDLTKYAYASFVCELVEALLEDEDADPAVLLLTLKTLHKIELGCSKLTLEWFQLQLLKLLGYGPQLNTCILCDSAIQAGAVKFDIVSGGIICSQCNHEKPNINGGTRAVLQQLMQLDSDKISRLKLSSLIERELENIVTGLVNQHLSRPLKSASFLQTLQVK